MTSLTLWGFPVTVSFAKHKPKWAIPRKAGTLDSTGNGFRIWIRGTMTHVGQVSVLRHEIGHILGRLVMEGYMDKAEAGGENFADLFVACVAEMLRVEKAIGA